jgi:hypothetical protein
MPKITGFRPFPWHCRICRSNQIRLNPTNRPEDPQEIDVTCEACGHAWVVTGEPFFVGRPTTPEATSGTHVRWTEPWPEGGTVTCVATIQDCVNVQRWKERTCKTWTPACPEPSKEELLREFLDEMEGELIVQWTG